MKLVTHLLGGEKKNHLTPAILQGLITDQSPGKVVMVGSGVRNVKNTPANGEDLRDKGSIAGFGRSPGEKNGNPLLYSCLENFKDRGAWQATVHGITKS